MLTASLLYLASQSPDPIAQDDRLAAKLKMEAPIITLQALSQRLTGETGVPITVADGIKERKATLYVRDRPARETMAALADTFFLTWAPDGKGYRLSLAKGVAEEEAEATRLDRERMKAKIDDTFAGWRELDPMSPADQAQQQAKLSRELATLTDSTDQASIDRRSAIERWLALSSEGIWSSFAVAYNGRQAEVDEALMGGQTLYASTRAKDDCPLLGESFSKYRSGEPSGLFKSAIALMRIDFAGARLEGRFALLGGRGGMGGPAGMPLLKENDSGYSISKRFTDWTAFKDSSVAGMPLAQVPVRNPRLVTLADQLAYLHTRTDVPIVADAYRIPCAVGKQTGETIGDFADRLGKFSALRFAKGAVAFRTNAGWLEARHLRYWRLDPREPEEDVLKPCEDLVTRGKQLDIESLAMLSARLTDIQIAGLHDFQCPTIVAFPTSQLSAYHSLRLWNALDETQRSRARSRDGLALADMEASQLGLAKAALRQIFWVGIVPEEFLPLAICDPAVLAKSRFFVQESDSRVWPEENEFERLMNPPPQLSDLQPGTMTSLCYGPDLKSCLAEIFTSTKR